MEIWKDIKGYEGLYQISNDGNVKSLNYHRTGKSKLLKTILCNNGYLYVTLSKNGKHDVRVIHRMVAEAFLDNPDNLPCINHKDEDKTNNHSSNLEFCTQKYNVHYSKCWMPSQKICSKSVLQFTKSGEFVAEYPSVNEAERQTGIHHGNISRCCNGQKGYSHVGGFIWKYKSPSSL